MSTVKQQGGSIAPPPTLESPALAAGIPPIKTVAEPFTTASGPQVAPMQAAGRDPISTVGVPGGKMGNGDLVTALRILSVMRAAGGMRTHFLIDLDNTALNGRSCTTLDRSAGTRYLDGCITLDRSAGSRYLDG